MSDKNEILAVIEHHFAAVVAKDIDEILSNYAASPDLLVFVEGPRWATVGYENVEKGWRAFCASAIRVEKCEWRENLRTKESDKMSFVAGVCELQVNIRNERKTIRFRGTFVLERDASGAWKIIHEHFSQPAENPYGIGDWLKQPQQTN